MSPARLSQILTGRAPVIRVAQAARLEDVLGVPRGTFFAFADDEADLVADYVAVDAATDVAVDEPELAEPAEDQPAGGTEWWCPVAGGGEG
jgi:hypothetical protein